MNMHVPQSYQSEVELMVLAAVPNQIVGPGQNRPVIGLVQDSIIGSALMTAYNNFLTAGDIKNLLIWVREYKDEFANMDGDWNTPPYFSKGTPLEEVIFDSPEFHWFHESVDRNTWTLREDLWTGRQLVSLIIPSIYLEKNNMLKDLPESARDRGKVVIRDGEYDQGVMDKNILGSKSQGLVHVIFNDLGSEKAEEFLDDMQNIVTNWLVTHGFSVGISDLIANDVAKESMGKVLNEKQRKVTELIQEVHRGKLKNDSGKPDSIEFELQVNKHLNAAVSDAGKIGIRELPYSNRMTALINSGSKGSVLNMGQMIACLGQQNIDGRRIKNGFKDRTLPFFLKYDDGAASKGFVVSSFIKGLKPHELFHHAQGGREGLIDTAVKTSKTGYIQRKLVKSMEECSIQADATVRDANGNIIQFLYGEDGVDPTKVEKQSLRTICMNHEEITAKYRFNATDMFDEYLTQDVIDKITMEVPGSEQRVLKPEVREKLDEHFNQLLDDKEFIIEEIHHNHPSVEVHYPINMDRLIKNIKNKYARNTVKSDLNPLEILQQLNEFEKSLFVTRMNPGNYLLSILLRQKLSPKILIKHMHFTKEAFQELAQVIYTKFQGALAEAGESVGTVAAQSIGEPATQLTLNSVDYNTKVTVMDGRKAKTVKIGKLIDNVLNKHEADIVKYPENRTDYLETNKNENIYIPACDRSGNMKWYKVDAVTRHLPIGDLVKVTTETGRELIATQGHSFLVWDNDTLIEKEGRELKIGEYLPTIVNYPELLLTTKNLYLCDYLSKKKYLYGSDFNQIKELYLADKRKNKVGFWKKHLNKTVTLPYNRLDSIIDVIKGKKLVTTEILPGIVYPKKCNRVVSRIPENFTLDREFGFICGIYLAEGWTTNTFMGISNNEEIVLNKVRQWCDDMNVTHHTVVSTNKRFEGSTSTDLKIHSVVLARLFKEVMNTGSCNKHIPSEAISGNIEFVLGILDGYFTGDGTVNKHDGSVSCSSVSKELIYGISQLCSRISVFGRINSIQVKRNNVGSQNIKRLYYFNIRNGYAQRFGETVGFTHPEKQHRINEITLKKKYRSRTGKYKQTNDMMYDKISNIEYVEGSEFVYDFTINNVHTFCMTDGLACKNTFHFAGIGSKSQVVRGVPRLEELMSATKEIKTPALTVYLKSEIAKNKDMSSQVVNSLEITTVRAIVTATKIYSDQVVPKKKPQETDVPDEDDDSYSLHSSQSGGASDGDDSYSLQSGGASDGDEEGGGGAKEDTESDVTEEDFDEFGIDDDLMEIYDEFQEYVFDEDVETNPIILRFKFDRKEMLDKDLKMEDVYNAIDSYFNTVDSQSIKCTYSDDNSASLIFRIQLISNRDDGDVDDVHRKLSTIEKQILDIPLKGVKGIKKATMYKEENTYRKVNGQYIKIPEWIVNTDGSNLSEVLAINEVDSTKTHSNDLLEVYRTFGVEAARELIIKEFIDVIESSGSYVNYRHVSLLADAMTNKGGIMPITRHGINKSDRGPLAKCSFEETSDVLIKAAVFGELDNMKGVSANIMFGQEVKVGTGAVELIYDEEFMLQDGEGIEDIELQTKELLENYCSDDRLDFNMEDVHKIEAEAKGQPTDHVALPIIELSDEDDSDSD